MTDKQLVWGQTLLTCIKHTGQQLNAEVPCCSRA